MMAIVAILMAAVGVQYGSPVPLLLGILAALEWRYGKCMESSGHAGF